MDYQREYFPLTHPQQGIWYTEKMYPGTSISNIAGSVRIKGNVKFDLLERAINLLIEKHDALRFRIVEADEPKQYIEEYKYEKIDFIDLSKCDNPINELYKWDVEQTQIPFQLNDSRLFYFAIIKISDEEGVAYGKVHHIISDAWTMSIVGNKIMEYYVALKNNESISTEKAPSYIEYVESEAKYLQSDRFSTDKSFWYDKMGTYSELTTLKVRNTKQKSIHAKRRTFLTSQKFTDKLHQYCNDNKISIYAVFLTALAMYINRVQSKDDIILGTPILNRTNFKEKNTIGMFINTSLIRINLSSEMDFTTASNIISKDCTDLLKHQKYPYDYLLKDIRKNTDTASNLYDIVLSYQNTKFNKVSNELYTFRWHFNSYQTNSLTVNINDREDEGRLIIDYDFHDDVYFMKEIEFIHKHIISLLWHALDNPNKKISKIEMLTESEKNKIIYEFNNTLTDFPKEKTVQELFEDQVKNTPNNIALVCEENTITYAKLNEKSNQLARFLRKNGLKRNEPVGLLIKRSIDAIISILAIIKAGGAFLPIDPEFPEERISYIIKDSKAKILLTHDNAVNKYDFQGVQINVSNHGIYCGDTSDLNNVNKPNDLIYVIYTSGSTGNPKGVMIRHYSVCNLLTGILNKIPFTEDKTVLAITTISFDIFVIETLLPLTVGQKVIIANEEEQKLPQKLCNLISNHNIKIIQMTPSRMQLFLSDKNSLRYLENLTDILIGGEVFPDTLLKLLKEHTNARIYNMYGPTETTVWSLIKDVTHCSKINIGKPIANTKIYILDKNSNPLPIGIPGEIYIGGAGVALGYINKDELTRDKFIQDPFNKNGKLYKTGDIARWYSEGDIEFLGRQDNQVKIRGFRIELDEIKNKLLQIKEIKNAIVAVKEDKNNSKKLCAYYISNHKISASSIRTYLSSQLPDYMVPSYYMKIDKVPYTPNGKIDTKSLPQIKIEGFESKHQSPRTPIERILADAWENILDLNNIGIDDNFFELGGDSLSAIKLQVKLLEKKLIINTQDLYNFPTIRRLAEKLNFNDCIPAEKSDEYNTDLNRLIIQRKGNKGKPIIKNVFLIGSTGYLGIHILDNLLSNTNVNVYCLVRGQDIAIATNRILNKMKYYFSDKHNDVINTRVFVICGDIEYDRLGLDEEVYNTVLKKIDIIIHAGANVKYYGEYHESERTNVIGTENVIKYAIEHSKKLYYISTMGVSGQFFVKQSNRDTIFTENDLYIGQHYKQNVYIRSKFEAERMIHNYISSGLNAVIMRVGNLTGRYSDGCFQQNISNNFFYNIIKSIIEIGVVSERQLNMKLEFTAVDLCSKAVVDIIMRGNPDNRTFHIYNNNHITIIDLVNILNDLGFDIKILNEDDYSRLIFEIASTKDKNQLDGIINVFNKDDKNVIMIDSEITRNYLNSIEFKWPSIDIYYIRKIIDHMINIHFLNGNC